MPDVQHKRGSRADLNTLAAANGLLLGQIYVITDEDRLAVATGVGSYQAAEKEGGGGGGTALELYAENPSSPTAPSATGLNAVAIGSGSTATGGSSFSFGTGASSTADQAFSFGLNAQATAVRSLSFFGEAGSTQSTALGYNSGIQRAKTITGSGAMALGGSYASGTDSFAAAIANNTATYGATGTQAVAIGFKAKASGANALALHTLSVASASGSFAAMRGTASADNAISIGNLSIASASESVALGKNAKSDIKGKYAYSSSDTWGQGLAQYGCFVLKSDTTDATAEALTTNNSTAGTTNQVILPNNSAYAFHGTIVARQQASGGTESAAWKVEGLIRREANAGTTVLVNSAITILDNTPAWGMALSADTTNGGLKIEVTGEAATNIRWVATLNTSELIYA